jgi:hypothetical protein
MEGQFVAEKIKADADGWEWTFTLKDIQLPTTGLKPRKSLFADRLMDASSEAAGDVFGGPQETGYQMVDGKRWPPMETCRDIVRMIGKAWVEGDPLGNTAQSKRNGRYAAERIADGFGVTVETAEVMVNRWLRTDVLTVDIYDNKTKRSGLKVKNGL